MNADLEVMALTKFGYGSWQAPYWFLDPEEGDDKNGTLPERLEAWLKLQQDGLCDLRDFHREIKEHRWHGLEGATVHLQTTWKQLIRLLLAYKGQMPTLEAIKSYQAHSWGRRSRETCVIELSAIPANDLAVGAKLRGKLFPQEKLNQLVSKRITEICARLDKHPPKLLVMYGNRDRNQWDQIANFVASLPATKQFRTVSVPTAASARIISLRRSFQDR